MAAPVVSGTVALMLQANPNADAEPGEGDPSVHRAGVSGLQPAAQGAGFLNTLGAVRLARFYAQSRSRRSSMPMQSVWSQHIIWGNHRICGRLSSIPNGERLEQQRRLGRGQARSTATTSSGARLPGSACDNIIWGTLDALTTTSSGAPTTTTTSSGARTFDDDNIVWGTGDDDNIVWGTDCGGADCDNIVWGTPDDDNIVWGTADDGRQHRLGHRTIDDNIVWGTSADVDDALGQLRRRRGRLPGQRSDRCRSQPSSEFGDARSSGGSVSWKRCPTAPSSTCSRFEARRSLGPRRRRQQRLARRSAGADGTARCGCASCARRTRRRSSRC